MALLDRLSRMVAITAATLYRIAALVVATLLRVVEYMDRLVIEAVPVPEDRFVAFRKRAFSIGWFGTMILAVLAIMIVVSLQPVTDNNVFVSQYTLENYGRLVEEPFYLSVFVDTVKLAGTAALLGVVMSYPAAYFIGVKLPERLQFPLTLAVIAPMWTLFIIRVFAWMTILGNNGTLHKILRFFGLVGEQFTLLGTEVAVIIVLTQVWFPMAFLPIYSAMSAIPEEFFAAAQDLGGTRWDIFRHIVFPLTLPSAFGGFLLVFLPAMGSYVIPLLVGGQQGFMIAQVVASQFLAGYDWPFGAALAILLATVILALTWVLQRIINLREALEGFA